MVDPQWAIAGVTVILVGITAWYALSTHQILKEAQKDRKIRYIGRRLEKLYYPILEILSPIDVVNTNSLEKIKGALYEIRGYHERWYYRHLGSKKLIDKLEEISDIERFDQFKTPDDADTFRKEILGIVKNDISGMLKELNELTK